MSDKENILEPYTKMNVIPTSTNNTMGPGPGSGSKTTRVIDQLHSEIDELKIRLDQSENKAKEYKQKYEVVTKRSQQLIENLTNTKHENDMMNSMLQRKDRRIKDIEEQLAEAISKIDDMEFDKKTKDSRLVKLQDNEKRLIAEAEILEQNYDSLRKAQKEYKTHFEKEISYLKDNFQTHLKKREVVLNQNIDKFTNNNDELQAVFKKLTNKSDRLEIMYKQKNNAIVEALKLLALAAKDHGNKSMKVLNECEEVLKAANRKLPNIDSDNDNDNNEVVGGDDVTVASAASAAAVAAADADSPSTPTFTPEPPSVLTIPQSVTDHQNQLNIAKRGANTTAEPESNSTTTTTTISNTNTPLERRQSMRHGSRKGSSASKKNNNSRRSSRIISNSVVVEKEKEKSPAPVPESAPEPEPKPEAVPTKEPEVEQEQIEKEQQQQQSEPGQEEEGEGEQNEMSKIQTTDSNVSSVSEQVSELSSSQDPVVVVEASNTKNQTHTNGRSNNNKRNKKRKGNQNKKKAN